jgi:hypothetical protein
MRPFAIPGIPTLLTATGLALSGGGLEARADLVIDSFDTDAAAGKWSATWGTSPVLTFDALNAGGGAAGSGSLQVKADYFTAADDGWEQLVVTRTFDSPVVGAQYTAVAVDVHVDPASTATASGEYGYFELKRPDGSALGGLNLSRTGWTTVQFNLAPTEGSLTGIIVQNGSSGFGGPVTLRLDNFRFVAPPAPQTVVTRFDSETDIEGWTATWGTAPVLEFSPSDAGGGTATSGSLKVTADYFTAGDDGWEQMVITKSFDPAVVGTDHVSVSVDVRVDPESVPTAAGQYGYFELKRTDGSAMGGVNLTSTNWTTITFPIAATEGTLTGIIIQNGNGGFQGPVTYYLDNFVFTQKVGGPQPPTLAIAKNPAAGLKLYASAPGQAYQRQNVVYKPSEDLGSELWWVNKSQPVTYSVTWADFPSGAANAGFQGHVMLATDTGGSSTPDWNDPNVILVEFQYANHPGADGVAGTADDALRARARFLHKVNEPASNAMLYRTQANAAAGPVGVLGEVWAPSMLGTWSISFRNNSDIVLTASDGSTVNLTMPEADIPFYEPAATGVSAHFGVQPNSDTRVGLSAVISRIKIQKGTTVVVDETFAGAELNPDVWVVRAADAAGVFPLSADTAYLVSWNLPDEGFGLKGAAVVGGPWKDVPGARQIGARRLVPVTTATLPGPTAGYFKLVK